MSERYIVVLGAGMPRVVDTHWERSHFGPIDEKMGYKKRVPAVIADAQTEGEAHRIVEALNRWTSGERRC